ncbi:hypothetical protein D9M69_477100 [compost metagenome]
MRAVYLDTEFTCLRIDRALISLALVDSAGAEFYVELTDGWSPHDCSDFVKSVVLPQLNHARCGVTTQEARKAVRSFLEGWAKWRSLGMLCAGTGRCCSNSSGQQGCRVTSSDAVKLATARRRRYLRKFRITPCSMQGFSAGCVSQASRPPCSVHGSPSRELMRRWIRRRSGCLCAGS